MLSLHIRDRQSKPGSKHWKSVGHHHMYEAATLQAGILAGKVRIASAVANSQRDIRVCALAEFNCLTSVRQLCSHMLVRAEIES